MKASQFTQLLHQQDQLSEWTYEALAQLVTQYPFCQNLRLLLMRKSQLEQNQHLEQNIRTAATYSTNRSHFYHFFRAGGGFQESLNPFQMAERFLKDQETSIPRASIPTEEPDAALSFDLAENADAEEDISHEIHFSNRSAMEDDDSTEFNLDEHLRKFREEKEDPSSKLERPDFVERGEHVFFLEDLIESEQTFPVEDAILEEDNEPQEIKEEEVAEEQSNDEDSTPAVEEPLFEDQEIASAEAEEEREEAEEIMPEPVPDTLEVVAEEGEEEDTPQTVEDFNLNFELSNIETPPASDELMETPEPIAEEETTTLAEEETPITLTSAAAEIPLEITNLSSDEQATPLPRPAPKASFSSWLQQFQAPRPSETATSKEQEPVKEAVAEEVQEPVAPEPPVLEEEPKKEETVSPPTPDSEEAKPKAKKNKTKKKKARKIKSLKDLEAKDQAPSEEVKASPKKQKKQKKKVKIRSFAAQSLNEDDDIASETLAIILAKQGAYNKAIRIYERLKLIYPEKSSFFASKIDELNKLL